ncbi:MAG TPA: hypothetical protein VIU40_03710, partial [Geobacteraceae bacterium]
MRTVTKRMLSVAAVVALTGLSMASVASAADRLTVKDSNSAIVFKVDDAGVVTTPKATITSAGWVGLGDATVPGAIFHAKGSTSYSTQLLMHRDEVNANGGAGFLAYHNNAGAMPNSGDRLGYFLFGSFYDDGVTKWAKNGGGFAARAEGAWTSTSVPTYFTFETAPIGSTTRSERLRISG